MYAYDITKRFEEIDLDMDDLKDLIMRVCGYVEDKQDDKPKISLREYNGDEGIGIVVDSDAMKVIIIQK